MLTVSSQRLQTKFGEVADIVQSREPVLITQYGKPTMMLISYDDEIMEMMRQYHAQKAMSFLQERAEKYTRTTDEELEELYHLIEEEREMVYQEKCKAYAK